MWWSSSRSEALYAGISSEMSAAPLVPSQPVGVFGGSVKGAQARGMGLRRREKRRCGWGWGGRVSLSARHVRAVLRQTGRLAFLAFYLPDCPLVLLCCLLHVTCCLITAWRSLLGLLLFPNPGGRGLMLFCNALSSFRKPVAPELLAGPWSAVTAPG